MHLITRLIAVLACLHIARGEELEWRSLFNGKDLTDWSVTLQNQPVGEDPESLVQVHDGEIQMYRDVPAGTTAPFGVITHQSEFSHFRLRFQYRWLGGKFPPRAEKLRDAGLIYHVKNADEIWPPGVECQIQEGDTGDLVFLKCGGFTWRLPDPDSAPEGQGIPGMLPESGGEPQSFHGGYIGRFEEADDLEDWNDVEVTVQGAESAVHTVNGRTLLRVFNLTNEEGQPLSSGRISFQLEGAQIAYRKIEIRELAPPLAPDRRTVSLSAVKDQIAQTRFLMISNPAGKSLETPAKIIGKDAEAFELIDPPASLAPGQKARWTLAFRPTHGPGRYSAGLQVGEPENGTFIVLQGIGLNTFEGKNEPPLQDIVHALGIPLDVGGKNLELDTQTAVIGESVDAAWFRTATPGNIRITPLARFSPPGAVPFGIFTKDDDAAPRTLGKLADASGDRIDAHQSLLPPLEGGAENIESDPGSEPFGFFLEGHQFVSFTDPERPTKAKIGRTARVFPIKSFQGETMQNTWLIGFEEATNGDYQDAVLMVENIKPVK